MSDYKLDSFAIHTEGGDILGSRRDNTIYQLELQHQNIGSITIEINKAELLQLIICLNKLSND